MIYMSKHKFINTVLIIILIIAVGFGAYFYYKLYKLENNNNDKKETQDLLGKISKLYLVPTDEEPTIATVSDPEKLRAQPFFNNAEKGDKVLLYTKAQKAVLYRPSVDKIIEISTISNKEITASKEIVPILESTTDLKKK